MKAASDRRLVLAPTLLAAVAGAAYVAWGPQSTDLAAATFRADLFADHGFSIWNNAWYAGHYLLSYSVIYPPLGALLGPRLTGALAVIAAAALFALLARRRFGTRALIASLWFAAGAAAWLLTGRIPFLLAVPFGLGALLAVADRRLAVAAALAVATSLASPVAGLFLAVAGTAILLTERRDAGLVLALGAAIPIVILNLAFPVGGFQPFALTSLLAVPLLAIVVWWLVPREFGALRVGCALYALLAVVAFAVDSPLGGNVTRLGALFAGPVLALVLWPRGRWIVIAVSVPLLYWQLVGPVRDLAKASGDASTERAFYQPLVEELDQIAGTSGSERIQIPPTKNRWEAAYVAETHPLARGWLRQLESDDFELFTDGRLDPESYRAWLEEHGVSYVAVPDAPRDYLAEDEVELIDSGLGYLTEVWSNDDWRLYEVDGATPIGVASTGPDSFGFDAQRPGAYEPAINYSRWWSVKAGDACVRDDNGRTVVDVRAPGRIELGVGLSGSGC